MIIIIWILRAATNVALVASPSKAVALFGHANSHFLSGISRSGEATHILIWIENNIAHEQSNRLERVVRLAGLKWTLAIAAWRFVASGPTCCA